MLCVCLCSFLFFQAEDGIRYLGRSRGLGDVYKRQGSTATAPDPIALSLYLMIKPLSLTRVANLISSLYSANIASRAVVGAALP